MKGSFNEKSLLAYSEMVAEKIDVDFAEGEVYDFTRCVRANGSFYGTSGRCRQGSPAGPKEEEAPKVRQGRGDVDHLATAADKKSALDAIRNEAAKRAAAGDEKGVDAAIKAYARLAKAQTKEGASKRSQVDLVTPQKQGQADVDRMKKYLQEESDKLKNLNDAQKQNPSRSNDPDVVSRKKVLERNVAAVEKQLKAQTKEEEAPKTTVAAKTAPTIGELAATRKQLSDKWQDTRAAASKAQNEHKFLTQRLRGDNSPEAKAQLLKSGKALDKAQQVRDRAQRAWQKVDDKIDRKNAAKKPEAPLRGQNLANKMMDHVNISNRVAANHGGAIRTKAAKEEHAAELKKAGVPDRATLTAALKAQRDEAKKPQ